MGPLVLFDGVCNFCNGAVNFIIRHDDEKKFAFAPLQSEIGQEMRVNFHIDDSIDSIILIENDRAYLHSTAGLRIAKRLGGVWSLGYVFVIVPAFIRDFCYRLFAKNRYRLFGRQEACMLPTPDVRGRFLSSISSAVVDRDLKPSVNPAVKDTEWYLMWCDFPNLNWARLRTFDDDTADVFDMDGRLIRFETPEEARAHLWEDEFSELSSLSEEDENELGVPLESITPPTAASDAELVQKMYVKIA